MLLFFLWVYLGFRVLGCDLRLKLPRNIGLSLKYRNLLFLQVLLKKRESRMDRADGTVGFGYFDLLSENSRLPTCPEGPYTLPLWN